MIFLSLYIVSYLILSILKRVVFTWVSNYLQIVPQNHSQILQFDFPFPDSGK